MHQSLSTAALQPASGLQNKDSAPENFTRYIQTHCKSRVILYGKLRVPSVQGGVHGKTDVNISPETMLDGSLTLLMLGENQKLKNTSTCKNLYRYNSQRPLAGVLLDNVKRMVYPSFKRE